MPLVRIDLVEGRSVDDRREMGRVIYDALLGMGVPKDDRFQILTEHAADNFVIDAGYLGIARSAACVVIQITMNEGRSVALKQALYMAIADGLHARVGLRREDVLINLVEVKKENWSFGNGEAQYV